MREVLIERALKTIRNYEMLKPGETILAAVSGGPDSVFMLHALNKLKRKLKIREITVCNLDHGIRDEESEEDSLFVKGIARELGLKFVHKRIGLKDSKPKEFSMEEAARDERYKFFKEAARIASATVVATGHTLDDQAETMLMRFIKGSSLKGIVGISPARNWEGLRIIRPLAELEKIEILRCLHDAGIPYRIDRTNLEDKYFRNVVRREVVPFLEKYNPRLKRSLFSLAEHLREDLEFITTEKSKAGIARTGLTEKTAEVDLKDIIIQPRAIQKEILRDMLDKSGGLVKKLSFRHWKEMEALVRRKGKGSSVHLPGGVRVTRTDKALTFSRI
ncbi:MAG: tRNA lysidine(34) synthetase TilS [Candidatus Omnitrophica bacterium]|nr:tRNA lysidine(34) synthetase TilS [Candidatus Omnitrophota bacterium]